MTICFGIFFYVHFESTYRFVLDAKHKHLVIQRIANIVSEWEFTQVDAPLTSALKDQYPQI